MTGRTTTVGRVCDPQRFVPTVVSQHPGSVREMVLNDSPAAGTALTAAAVRLEMCCRSSFFRLFYGRSQSLNTTFSFLQLKGEKKMASGGIPNKKSRIQAMMLSWLW